MKRPAVSIALMVPTERVSSASFDLSLIQLSLQFNPDGGSNSTHKTSIGIAHTAQTHRDAEPQEDATLFLAVCTFLSLLNPSASTEA